MTAVVITRDRYVDPTGREWVVRELVDYGSGEIAPGRWPRPVRSTVVFESDRERRVADDAPLDWRKREGALAELFERARPPAPRADEW